eukprot:364273-Chlamydomonas_euryale.AAC.4
MLEEAMRRPQQDSDILGALQESSQIATIFYNGARCGDSLSASSPTLLWDNLCGAGRESRSQRALMPSRASLS